VHNSVWACGGICHLGTIKFSDIKSGDSTTQTKAMHGSPAKIQTVPHTTTNVDVQRLNLASSCASSARSRRDSVRKVSTRAASSRPASSRRASSRRASSRRASSRRASSRRASARCHAASRASRVDVSMIPPNGSTIAQLELGITPGPKIHGQSNAPAKSVPKHIHPAH